MRDRRLIEEALPLEAISEESVREKSIRRGHISTLHIWWARRPLAACRTAVFGALVRDPADEKERKKMLDFVKDLCKWESSLNPRILNKAKDLIKKHSEGKIPKVLDCFAGGGAIPLEASRLGCETYALEYNPVAVLIEKATLEYPQKYGRGRRKTNETLLGVEEFNPLLENVKKWGEWILKRAKKEIGKFYPEENDGSIPVGYIWAKTVKCKNPSCGAEIPLFRQLWLAKKAKKKIVLKPVVDKRKKEVDFEIVEDKKFDFDPSKGTTRKASATCLICGSTVDAKTMRKEAQQGRMGQRMVVVILHHPAKRGKMYRIATENDLKVFKEAGRAHEEKIANYKGEDSLVPDELLPPVGTLGFRVNRYGITKWGDLFNHRQKLALITFVEKVKDAYRKMVGEGYDEEYAKAVGAYLGLGVDRLASYNTNNAPWHVTGEKATQIYGRQALPMVWDYTETNPFGTSFSWQIQLDWILGVINHCSQIPNSQSLITVSQSSATSLPYPDNYFDAALTDPPYYDNVPYSDLSDFFYVWLKRTIGDLYPDLFATPLTPKSLEIVQNPVRHTGDNKRAKIFYEEMLTEAFREIRRVLKPNGIIVTIFAHKTTSAWETLVTSLLNSGLTVTASWPIHTEMTVRLRARESAALASSIFLVCRKREGEDEIYLSDVKKELQNKICNRLDDFWDADIRGADFFISAIGASLEIFGKYKRMKRLSGKEISVSEFLIIVRGIVTDYALEKILKGGRIGKIDEKTRFYILHRWAYGSGKVHFDDARKLAQAIGVEVDELMGRTELLRKDGENVSLLGPKERGDHKKIGEPRTDGTPAPIIDVLHRACLLWEQGDRNALAEFLARAGYKDVPTFWTVAQALSEILSEGNKEKQLIQCFLNSREALESIKVKRVVQIPLFEHKKSDKHDQAKTVVGSSTAS